MFASLTGWSSSGHQIQAISTMSRKSLSRSSISCKQMAESRVLRYDFFNRCFVVDVTQTTTEGQAEEKQDEKHLLERRMAAVLGNNVCRSSLDQKEQQLSDFCLMLKLYPIGSFSPEFWQLFEESLLRFLSLPDQQFVVSDLTYLFHLISGTKRRPIKVLRRISDLICDPDTRMDLLEHKPRGQKNDRIAGKSITSGSLSEDLCLLIHSMCKTAFLDGPLLQHACDLLLRLQDRHLALRQVKRNTLTSCLIALGQMRFKHTGLLDAVTGSIPDTGSSRRPYHANELMALINTLAVVDHRPPDFEKVVQRFVIPVVTGSMDSISDPVLIQFFWSLAYFNLLDSHLVASILQPNGRIMSGIKNRVHQKDDSVWTEVAKLRQIRAVAVHEMGITDPKVVPQDDLLTDVSSDVRRRRAGDATAFATSVTDSLNLFLPKGVSMQTNVPTELGFEVDARFCVNVSLKALRLEEWVENKDGKLPDGFQVLNLLTCTFRSCLLSPTSEAEARQPVGQMLLQQRLLKKACNQSVVLIDDLSFVSKADAVARVNYLQQKIRQTVCDATFD